MIVVARIVGEGIDLASGSETPKSLVLSNGQREITLQVDDETIQEVIRMASESGAIAMSAPPYPEPTVVPPHVEVPHIEEPALAPPAMSLDDEEDVTSDGAGDEYDDPATGVASI